MSRASEWAKRYRDTMIREPARYRDVRDNHHTGPYMDAEVGQDGRCVISINGNPIAWLESERALALASWIIDMFDEPTP